MEVLENIKVTNPEMVVIMITAHGSKDIAIEAIRKGAYDYFSKPFDVNEMRTVVRRALEKTRLQHEVRELKEKVGEKGDLRNLVGKSKGMEEVFEIVRTVVDNDVTVLITGESGTGKELIAEAIHYNSPRRAHPFVKVNCAAIPETLMESELFGYERGAFTGATKRKPGKFEVASGGTLLLDEIGDIPLATQAKLLRVLQEGEFERVGGEETIKVDVRIVAATNQNLPQAIKEKRFREDLFYRLNVVSIDLPPLRERKEDVPLLAQYFLKKYRAASRRVEGISKGALDQLMSYRWPGNVRELENTMERTIILAKRPLIEEEDLSLPSRNTVSLGKLDFSLGSKSLREIEKTVLATVLEETDWNLSRAAQILEISRTTLYSKIKKHELAKQSAE